MNFFVKVFVYKLNSIATDIRLQLDPINWISNRLVNLQLSFKSKKIDIDKGQGHLQRPRSDLYYGHKEHDKRYRSMLIDELH
jgi:hypothetical protein